MGRQTSRTGRRGRPATVVVALVAATLGLAALLAGCGTTAGVRGPAKDRRVPGRVAAATLNLAAAEATVTTVATVQGTVPGSATPGGPPDTTVPASWYGYPSVLPVIGDAPGWLEVRLAQRPNGSVAWIPLADAALGSTPYRLVLDLATEHLAVYEHGRLMLDFPAGIGTPTDPTPTGDYFVTMKVPPPTAGYGPFVLVTSDHSDTITDWEESGDAIIAIHGPITTAADAQIGTTGAAVSHGCIRLHDADLAQLATVPPGTPLDIVAG